MHEYRFCRSFFLHDTEKRGSMDIPSLGQRSASKCCCLEYGQSHGLSIDCVGYGTTHRVSKICVYQLTVWAMVRHTVFSTGLI